MAYQLIFTTSLSEFYPESVGGVTPVMSHGLLSGLLESELSGDAAQFLAEPSVKTARGRIDWLTPLEGEARDMAGLAGAERDRAEDGLCLMAGSLAGLGARLTGAESGERRLAGRVISRLAVEAASAAAGIGGPRRVFMVGGVPVMAGWGLGSSSAEASKGRGGHDLTEAESLAVRRILAGERPRDFIPRMPPPAVPVAPVPEGALPAPVPLPPVPDTVPPARARGSRDWLRALAAALLAFLLALLAVLILDRDFRGTAAKAGAVPTELPDESLEPGLRSELDALKALYGAALAACRHLPDGAGPAVPDGTDGPGGPGGPDGPPGPDSLPPAPDSELRLPADTDDLAFLDGCWKSDAGLHSFPERLPFHYVYCFSGGTGAARVLLEETGRDGTPARTCTTAGTATIEDGILVIVDDGPKCDRGPDFVPVKIECMPGEGGTADCMYHGGRDPSRTRFTYVGDG